MSTGSCVRTLILAAASLAVLAADAQANERHFTYTYETATLPAGATELEIWNTARVGRDKYFSRLEHRLEFEWGVTDRLQSAIYYNTKGAISRKAGSLEKSFYYPSLSWEWKYKLSDPVADSIGSALYAEVGYNPHEYELELKLLLDKKIGSTLLATNLVFEQEYKYNMAEEAETETVLELDLGVAWFLSPSVTLGIEARVHGAKEEEFEAFAVYAGPVLSWVSNETWVAFTIMGQLGAVHVGDVAEGEEDPGFEPDLSGHEKVNARLLLGFHF